MSAFRFSCAVLSAASSGKLLHFTSADWPDMLDIQWRRDVLALLDQPGSPVAGRGRFVAPDEGQEWTFRLMTQRDLVTTSAGVTIGLAHVRKRPLHSIRHSEEALQRALLDKPQRIDWPSVLMAVGIGLALAAMLLHEMGALL